MEFVPFLLVAFALAFAVSVMCQVWPDHPLYSVTYVTQDELGSEDFELKADATRWFNRCVYSGKYTQVDLWEGDRLIVSWSK